MEGIAPQPKYVQHITFEGCDCVVLSPEEYEALWNAAESSVPSAIERRPDYHDGLIEECAQVCEQQIKVEEAHGRLQARSILTRCAAAIRAVRFSAATDVGHTP